MNNHKPLSITTSPTSTHVYTVQSPHFSQAPIAVDLSDLDHIAAAHASEEFEGFINRINTRDIIPLSPDDRVVIIDHALTSVLVRVVDGTESGGQGWIPASWLHSAGSATVMTDELLTLVHAA